MKLIGLAHDFFWPTILGRVLIYGSVDEYHRTIRSSPRRPDARCLPTAPLVFLFVILAPSACQPCELIKSASAVQRDGSRDAAAVQFTRNPSGIAGALRNWRPLQSTDGRHTARRSRQPFGYFADSNYEPWSPFFARIRRCPKGISAIDPAFDGNFPKVKMLAPTSMSMTRLLNKHWST